MRLSVVSFLKAVLSGLYVTRLDRAFSGLTSGVGVVFMLHRVRPADTATKGPNRILEVTPEFLDEIIVLTRRLGYDIISLDDAHARLKGGEFDRPFACFTLDDGYRDNRDHALPVFQRHQAPFTVFVPSDFADGRGDLWWVKLEVAIEAVDHVDVRLDGVHQRLPTATREQKDAAFSRIYWWLRGIPEHAARSFVAELCARTGLDLSSLCAESILSWGELRDLARDPLVTIGAHTRRHLALAKLSRAEAMLEIAEGHARLEKELGRKIHHFSYPYGDEASAGPRDFEIVREAGFRTAVTTRKGLLHSTDSASPFGLCRLSLNGDYQKARYVQVLMSGLPFAILNVAGRLRPTRGGFAGLTRFGRPRVAHTSS